MRIPASLIATLLATGTVFGQTPAADSKESTLKFEASDIHSSPKSTNATVFMSGGLRGDRFSVRNATMLDLISTAYGKERETVLGGPSWLEFDRFDIAAKPPKGAGQKDVGPMLKALLAERFQLKAHEDTKPTPAVVLTAGKGKPKIKEADGSGQGNCTPGDPRAQQPGVTFMQEMHCRNVTLDVFANFLRGYAGPYFDQPVVNKTGIDGSFDIDLKFTPRPLLSQAGADAANIYTAVETLGLKLETQSISRPVLFVDSVQEKPTPNTADVSNILPRQVLKEFEVAVIKPSQPDANPRLQVQPSGQVDLEGVPLRVLVAFIWGYDPFTTEMVVNAPKSMENQKWDIMAKVARTESKAEPPQLDIDDVRSMLKTLIEDRFNLKWHVEDRPVTAYTLTAVKPKMKKGDPAMRASWKEGPGPDGKDPRIANPILSRLVSFQNISMAQFAEDLQRVANGYIHNAVIDETGLEGGYDFTLSFSAAGLLQSGGPGRGGDQNGAASGPGTSPAPDPNGALSLFDAIKQQLGLKLDMKKRPLPVLVIDSVEEKPTEN
ncbi:MAG TPA: TIGR03435 family protein [Bryobacteraceae bacterium]|nr:TIGR03435 family protein [Bryobacteraceae bacterium]